MELESWVKIIQLSFTLKKKKKSLTSSVVYTQNCWQTILCGSHISAHFARGALIVLLLQTTFPRMFVPWTTLGEEITLERLACLASSKTDTEQMQESLLPTVKDSGSLNSGFLAYSAIYCAFRCHLVLLNHPEGLRELGEKALFRPLLLLRVINNLLSLIQQSFVFYRYSWNYGSLTR